VKLKELSTINPGYLNRSAVEPDSAGSHHLLQIRDFDDDRRTIFRDHLVKFTPTSPSKISLLQNGDVVFLAKGAKNFAVVVPDLPSPCLAASYFFIIRPEASLLSGYLAWYLNQPSAQMHFKRLATTGAHMPVVNRDVLGSLKVPVPGLATQRKIVELDALASMQTKLLAELTKKRRALADAACRRAANESF